MNFCTAFLLLLVFCWGDQPQEKEGVFEPKLTKVLLPEGDYFFWNNETNDVVLDSAYFCLEHKYLENKDYLIEEVSDTSKTEINICSDTENIRHGDLIFILIDKIENVPFYIVFGVQLDSIKLDCSYPDYLFEYINSDRQNVVAKLKSFYVP